MANVTLNELRNDFSRYGELCLKIIDKHSQSVALKPNYAQTVILQKIAERRAQGRPPRVVVLKARQTGVSTLAQALLFHACHLFPNRMALVLAHKIESAEMLFNISKRLYAALPKPLQFKKRYSTKRVIHFEENDSRLQVEVAGEARGYTANLVHLSELAFYDDAETTLTAVLQTVPLTPESLVIVESTPKGMSGEFYRLWKRARRGDSDFIPVFIPWFEDPGYRMKGDLPGGLTEPERELKDLYGVDDEQLVWRRWCIQNNCSGDAERFLQEYPSDDESCFLASGRPVYDRDSIRYYRDLGDCEAARAALEHTYELEPGETPDRPILRDTPGGRLRIYFPPEKRHQYVLGADPSAGDPGSDPSPIIVLDRHTLHVAAVWYGRTPPDRLARYATLLARHYNHGLVVGEANNHGYLFLHELAEQYDHIYYRGPAIDSISGKPTDRLGYYTSVKTREHVINVTRKYVRERLGLIYDPAMIEEMRTMVYTDRDRAEADPDDPEAMDDCMMAFGIALEAHKGHPDAPLDPIPLETLRDAEAQRNRRRMLGLEEGPVVVGAEVVTCEELERYDERQERRRLRREALGLGEAR